MAKFNVTRVVPDGFLHTAGFMEVIDSLTWALSALGHEASTTQNWFSERQEHNIVFGAELIADFQRFPAATTIFNLEQPSHPNMEKVRRQALEANVSVWDYSHRAVLDWRAAGHTRVAHCPIGYTPNLSRFPVAASSDIDVAFFGWMTPRRAALIDDLRSHGLNVFASTYCYGGARDQVMSRSKLILNVHHDGRDRFEIVRCSYPMANHLCIVSESSVDDDEYSDLRGLTIVPYRLLTDVCRSLCSAYTERFRCAEEGFESIRRRDFTLAVEAALDSTPSTPLAPTSPALSRSVAKLQQRQQYLAEGRELGAASTLAKPSESAMNAARFRAKARFAQAQQSGDMRDFVQWMQDHARGNVVEIGVRDGASTSAFLTGVELHGGHVYSIDVQPCGDLFRYHPQWSFLQANSFDLQTIIKFIPFEIDLLLIDGDHSRAGVVNDFEYARQVRAGGLVLFHDIDPEDRPTGCNDMSWPGDDVKNVYNELVAATAPMGWTSYTVPGRYGLGVLQKPPMTAPDPIPVTEETASQ